jgi:hypothetical protein
MQFRKKNLIHLSLVKKYRRKIVLKIKFHLNITFFCENESRGLQLSSEEHKCSSCLIYITKTKLLVC